MHREAFMNQWEDLTVDFITELSKELTHIKNTDEANRWYKTASYKWSGLSDLESVQLEHLKMPEFAAELRSEIDSFSFKDVNFQPNEKKELAFAAGVMGCAASAAVLNFFTPLTVIPSVAIGGVIGVGVSFGIGGKLSADADKKSLEVRKQAYTDQLKDHLQKLLIVFDKYGVE